MKTVIIANVSANGKVLLAENPQHQAPPEALGFFVQRANQAGNLIIGKKTYEVLKQFPGGVKAILPSAELVILSKSEEKIEGYKVVDKAKKAISWLEEKGFAEIVIGGGAKTYSSFLEKDLVSDIYFNIIPIVIGSGGIIGNADDLYLKFKVAESSMLTPEIVQIHFEKA
jgi:dihydrofolate reductase